VNFVDELPRNATGKVMKHLLGNDAAGTTSGKSS
jgi:acyl-coenzyme A synthetase/AMP-(fatty) acid ligase